MKQKSKRKKSVTVMPENDVTKVLKIQISAAEKKQADLALKVSQSNKGLFMCYVTTIFTSNDAPFPTLCC